MRVVSLDRSARFTETSPAKLSGRSITFGWMLFAFVISRITVSGPPEKGFDTLVQPVTRVHRKLNTVEETPTTTEFHVTMIPPSWVGMADGYWADVERMVGEPKEIEAMFPVRSRLS